MASFVGRELLLKKNNTVIVGVRTKSFAFNGENINITTGEDDGKQLLLAASGEENISISFDGIAKDDLIRDIVLGGGTLLFTDVELEWPLIGGGTTPATLQCNFRLSSYEESGAYNDAITFTGTLDSSGDWTYTPEA